jgi:hypothetical protein
MSVLRGIPILAAVLGKNKTTILEILIDQGIESCTIQRPAVVIGLAAPIVP